MMPRSGRVLAVLVLTAVVSCRTGDSGPPSALGTAPDVSRSLHDRSALVHNSEDRSGDKADQQGHPLPVAPRDFGFAVPPTCNWIPPGSGMLETGDGICSYQPASLRFATVTGQALDTTQPNRIEYLAGARVVLYVETLDEALVAVTNQWGEFAFVNIPVRKKGITCDWVRVEAAGFGGLTVKGDSFWESDGYVQNLALPTTEASVAWGQGVELDRCRDWKPPGLRAD